MWGGWEPEKSGLPEPQAGKSQMSELARQPKTGLRERRFPRLKWKCPGVTGAGFLHSSLHDPKLDLAKPLFFKYTQEESNL